MKLEGFTPGAWRQQYQYKSFSPVLVNHGWSWEDSRINTLLERATRALGELNAFSLIVPDIDLFIEMHIAKEANQSSRIEGTQTAMDEALMSEDLIAPEKRDDWHEVRNYIDAINIAIEELKTLPLSNRLMRETHAILTRGVRGEHKMPGEFRTSQNWIGGSGLNNRASYYDALMAVRTSGDMIHWIRFFLTGVAETATKGRETFRAVLALRTEAESRMHELGRRGKTGLALLRLLYRRPVVTAAQVAESLEISTPTANLLVGDLLRFGLLQELTGFARNRVFAFDSYLRLFLS